MVSIRHRTWRCRIDRKRTAIEVGELGFMFQLGELHGKALGTAFQKDHSSVQRRFLFFLWFL